MTLDPVKLEECAKALFRRRMLSISQLAPSDPLFAPGRIGWHDLSDPEREEYLAEAYDVLITWGV